MNPYKNKPECWERLCFERGADAMYGPAYEKGRADEREGMNNFLECISSIWEDLDKQTVFVSDEEVDETDTD